MLVRKVQLSLNAGTGGKNLGKTQVLLPKEKDKAKEAECNETLELTVDPSAPLEVEISTSKGSIGAIEISSLKLEKGKEKALPLEIDEAQVTLYLTAVDFGQEAASSKAKPHVSSEASAAGKKEAPMPAAEEVEKRFAEIARNANLNETMIKAMGLREKWSLVQNFQAAVKIEGQEGRAEFWVTKLRAEPSAEVIKQLTFHFGSKGVNWLEEFAQLGGVKELTALFERVLKSPHPSEDEQRLKSLVVHALDKAPPSCLIPIAVALTDRPHPGDEQSAWPRARAAGEQCDCTARPGVGRCGARCRHACDDP